ncbi:bifunctional folylpolyglutamate synthase/dihydrofolate synthase [Amycolatopsis deserti]|nr:cyanophycin synthetase [Amycolatopsis deserti]
MRTATVDEVEQYLLSELPPVARNAMTAGTGRLRAARLLARLGNPQDTLRVVHIAGTAGKGSVAAFVSAILHAHGFRVGTFLSPHVHSVLERFQLDGRPADAAAVTPAVRAVREYERDVSGEPTGQVTMFEAATAVAFQLFRQQNVDYAVVETGIGGLHDATNTVTRRDKLAVLTAVGLDHTAVLGETVPEIAAQKAGIMAQGGMAVAVRGAAADAVFAGEAARRRCSLNLVSEQDALAELPAGVVPGLGGPHQRVNAGLAVRAVQHLARRDGWALDPGHVADGLRRVRLPGRFERRCWSGRPVVLDGAHNPVKLAALVAALRSEWPGRKPVWVLTAKPDKDIAEALRVIAPCASAVVATQFDTVGVNSARGPVVTASEIAAAARQCGIESVHVKPRMRAAVRCAVGLSAPDTPVVVTGSFFAVADAGELMS